MPRFLLVVSLVLARGFLVSTPVAAQDLAEALDAYAELVARQECGVIGACDPHPDPTDEELRERVHALHRVAPAYQRIADLPADDPVRTQARAVCAVVPAEYVEQEGDTTYVRVTEREFPGLLGHDGGWALVESSTGLMVRLVRSGDLDVYGVLTVAHTSTHREACRRETGHFFVFGLTQFSPVERDDGDWIAVPSSQVFAAGCVTMFLRTTDTDIAFYELDVDDVDRFEPQEGEMAIATAGSDVMAIGFPYGMEMRSTRGLVDAFARPDVDREYDTSLYALDGMSGAPVYGRDGFAGMHLSNVAVPSDPVFCVACPIPCDLRAAVAADTLGTSIPCTEGGSWSTEAGYVQLASLFRARFLVADPSLNARRVRLEVTGGAIVLPIGDAAVVKQRPHGAIRGQFVLRRGERVLLVLPPEGSVRVLRRPVGAEGPRWRTRRGDELMRRAGARDYAEFMRRVDRFVVTDPSGQGGMDFDLVPERKRQPE